MLVDESVAIWVTGIKEGDPDAIQRLWEQYFQRLVGIAQRILRSTPKRWKDEEDIALSAFESFSIRAAAGKFPRLDDPGDLWKLLVTITVRKALGLRRKENRRGAVLGLDELKGRLQSAEPDPKVAAAFVDEFDHVLTLLDNEEVRRIVVAKLQGYTNQEIARDLGRSISFVERKLQLVRHIWVEEAA